MTESTNDQPIDDWLAFAHDDHDDHAESGGSGSWRHPAVYAAIVIGILVVIGLIVLRPTGEAKELAEASRSVIGLPTDFYDATVSGVREGPCPFVPDQTCVSYSFLILEGPDADRTYLQSFPEGATTPNLEEGQRVVLSYRAPNAAVVSVSTQPCSFDASVSCQQVTVVMTSGDDAGAQHVIEAGTDTSFYPQQQVEVTFTNEGDAVAVVPATVQSQYQFADLQRSPVLIAVFLVFAVSVIALGRWRGVAALAGLGATIVIVLLWLLPAILDGKPPIWVALVGACAVAYVALYISHGFSLMTTVALLGTVSALFLTTLLSQITVSLASFTGFVSEESSLLVLFDGIDVSALVVAGMVLGAAGALDDVTVTQASSVWQIGRIRPNASFGDLWSGGLRIGQHHIGSTVNTLLLAYLGASLPLAVLFILAAQSLGTVVNSEVVAVEIVRTLVGSIGLVAAVPVTTWLAARIVATGSKSSPGGPAEADDAVAVDGEG
ncbi:MAG: YibE/F family protein [Acidimicrobiia bacterium]